MTLDILDCTLRDGGYNNAWDFSDATVEEYLNAIDQTGVRYVEMGYRTGAAIGPGGPYRYCTDSLLWSKRAGRSVGFAVMVDGKTLCESGVAQSASRVADMFGPADGSPIELIRIAATVALVPSLLELTESLHRLGYRVALNIMQGSLLDISVIETAVATAAAAPIDFLYLADSFGALTPTTTRSRIRAMRESFGGRVGFHAHDNLGLALGNTLAAIDAGATIVDGSVLGMGRGAGNVRTEQLLASMRQDGHDRFTPRPLFDIVERELALLQRRYAWGSSPAYMAAAETNVHPTYVQELIGRVASSDEVLGALRILSDHPKRSSFSAATLEEVLAVKPKAGFVLPAARSRAVLSR